MNVVVSSFVLVEFHSIQLILKVITIMLGFALGFFFLIQNLCGAWNEEPI